MSRLSQIFAPKEREFFDLFEEAAGNCVRAAELLDTMLDQWPDHGGILQDVIACEHEGDRITHDIIQRLNQTFVTPFDREDIIALASGLDDIVDYIEEVADFLGLYRIEAPMEQAQRMARVLHGATVQINGAIPQPAHAEGHPPLHTRGQQARERGRQDPPRGHRIAVRARDRPDDGDPLEGHLRAPRRRNRFDGNRHEHHGGHHHQEPVVHSDVILWIVVGTAIAFDFTNGFHDTANSIATSVSTRAMPPRLAVLMAASLNFVGAFLSLAVAATIATGIVNAATVTLMTVFAGLIGAIVWNLVTWWFGLPSSSSHALIGGMVGATLAAEGPSAVLWSGLVEKVLVPGLVAPVLALVAAGVAILIAYRIVGRQSPGVVTRGFRLGQLATSALFSLSHGTNDAQKTMGIIFLALVANGNLSADAEIPNWVVISSATAIALGTYFGGWRIIRTMGSKIIKMDPPQGFASQGAGAAVILSASHVGFPLSTTHVMSGAIMGAGAAKRLSAVRWGVAGNIVLAWVLTLPCAAAVGAATYGVISIFGNGATGPLVVVVVLAIALLAFAIHVRRPTVVEGTP